RIAKIGSLTSSTCGKLTGRPIIGRSSVHSEAVPSDGLSDGLPSERVSLAQPRLAARSRSRAAQAGTGDRDFSIEDTSLASPRSPGRFPHEYERLPGRSLRPVT